MAADGITPGELARARRAHAVSRLRLWRLWTETRVLSASPLLLEMAASERLDLAGVASRLRPPVGWPHDTAYLQPLDELMPSPIAARSWRGRTADGGGALSGRSGPSIARLAARHRRAGGVLLRSPLDPAGGLAIRVGRRSLELAATLGNAVLVTDGDLARLWLDGGMPDAALAAALFRPASDLVGHPLLAGRRYRLIGALRSTCDDVTMVTFRAPRVPHGLPPGWTGRVEREDVVGFAKSRSRHAGRR